MAKSLLTDLAGTPVDSARFALDLSNQRVSLVERTSRGFRERASVRSSDADFEEQIQAMRRRVARGRGGEARVDLFLPEELTLARVETFPAEARRQLREEAWWRLDSLTPYRPEELCYDVALLGAEPTTGFLNVAIALAPRDIVDEAVAYAKAWGFAPQRVTAAPLEGFPHGPLFFEVANAAAEIRPLRRAAAGLALAASLLVAIGVVRGVGAREALAEELETRQAEIEAQLADALAVREETLELAFLAVQPLSRRRSAYLTIEWLDAMTAALPPGALVEQIDVDGDHVRIVGVAAGADAVLSAVSTVPAIVDARLAAPVRASGVAGAPARFVIEARLRLRETGA